MYDGDNVNDNDNPMEFTIYNLLLILLTSDVQLHAGVYDNVNLNNNIFRITLFLSSVQMLQSVVL